MQKSQWKIDFLLIFSPIFQDFCHFIHLWNIQKIVGVVGGWGRLDPGFGATFEFGGRGCINPCTGRYIHRKPMEIFPIPRNLEPWLDESEKSFSIVIPNYKY